VSGDVLEFLSPFSRKPILLRIYEFESAENGNKTNAVHSGQKGKVRIPYGRRP
jgi:putative protease